MKLHTKLTVSLVVVLMAVMGGALAFQYGAMDRLIAEFASSNVQLLKEREERAAENIFSSIERAVAGSLERGEMEKFSRILQQQRNVRGLMEFSLHDRQGVVTHSSNDQFLKKTLPKHIQDRLGRQTDMELTWTDDAVSIFKPLLVNNDCVRCHVGWQPGEIGGVLHFRFSKQTLARAEAQAADIVSTIHAFMMKYVVATLSVVVLVLVIGIHLLVTRYVSKPLTRINVRLHDIAEGGGDLTARIDVTGRDEIGRLAISFNTFIEKLQEMIGRIGKNAVVLHDSSSRLFELSDQISREANQMSSRSRSAAAEISRMNDGMTSAASIMARSSSNVGDMSSSTEQMNSHIDAIVQSTENAHRVSEEAVEKTKNATIMMEELDTAAKDIVSVTQTITDISEQTNLLALNATIEAARAGEAGKGFAVVANEIKELAKQTAESTRSIHDKNLRIQQSSNRTMQEIEAVSQTIANVNEIVSSIASSIQEQSLLTQQIANNISQATEGILDATTNVTESAQENEKIVEKISSVNVAAEQVAKNNQSINQNADEMVSLAKQLKDMVGRFTV